jgi:hypothetical protein
MIFTNQKLEKSDKIPHEINFDPARGIGEKPRL